MERSIPLSRPCFDPAVVEKHVHHPIADSTNTLAREHADLPQNGLTIITADRQTNGRGQRGNSFYSDHPGGIWCTIIQPIADIGDHFRFNRALAVAIAQSLAALAPPPPIAIKWPNDIYWGARKICGMLLESHPHSDHHIVIGFGLNVNIKPEEFPDSLRSIATSVMAETGKAIELAALLERIVTRYDRLSRLSVEGVHEHYTRLLYRIGAAVELMGERGTFEGVEPDGRASVMVNDNRFLFSSGPMRFCNE